MEYEKLRKDILKYLVFLQQKGFSYQNICDFINAKQTEYVWYKDFFTRFRSKSTYYKGAAKRKKLALLHFHLHQFFQQNIDQVDLIQDHLKQVITDALAIEFGAYYHVNRSAENYLKWLPKFYASGSPAFLSIAKNLKHKKQYGWILDKLEYGSSFKLLSIKVENVFSQNAVVNTHEFWKLYWIDQDYKKLQYKYEAINEQVYLLSKDKEEGWRIIENIYKSGQSRVAPEFIDEQRLEQLELNNPTNKLTNIQQFMANNQLLYAIEFIKRNPLPNFSSKETKQLNHLRTAYLNVHRLFNTDVIDYTQYKEEIASLKSQTIALYQ